jgi:hypothetical protein
MPRSNPFQPSFNAGEISPRLHARTDFQKYRNALSRCQNAIPLPEGAWMRRAGTRYVSEVNSSSAKSRLRKFQYSTTQAYVLELAPSLIRFFRNQGRISVADTDASISNGTFSSNINDWDDRSTGGAGNAIAHDNTNGRLTLQTNGTASDDIGWAEQDVAIGASYRNTEHVLKFQVIGAPSDRIELRIGSATTGSQIIADQLYEVGYHCVAFNPGGNATVYIQFRNRGNFRDKDVQIDNVSLIDNAGVSVQTPYAEADLYDIVGVQSGNFLYLYHEEYPTYRLERHGHTSWSLEEVAWQDGPYLDENDTSTTLTFSAATGLGVTVTASSVEGINDGQGFLTTDIGRLIRLTDGTVNWGWAVITARTSTTVVTADVRRTVVVTTAETKWRLGAWSGTTGYASCGSFYEQRMIAAGTVEQPQTFWGSQSSDFENMAPDSPNSDGTTWAETVEDDDAFDYTLSADDVHAIRWLSAGENTLAIGTTAGEWVPESTGAVLTPTDITVRQQTSHGSARIQPVRVDHVVLFVQRAKRKLREFGFNFDVDGYTAPDMTRLAQHISKGGFVEMDYAEEPNSLIYAVRADGRLMAMTYRREEDVVGWSRHVLGGSFSSGIAVVESVTVIPGNNGSGQVLNSEDRDEVWVIVKRTINGATKRYIEVFEGDFEGPDPNDYDDEDDWETAMMDAQKDVYYADSIITYDGSAATSITGLDHLEGQTVKILADGAIHAEKTVSSGTVTLDSSASIVQIGLGYKHRLKTLKIEGGTVAGTAVGKTKRIPGVTLVVLNSHTVSAGPDEDNLKEYDFREVGDAMDAAAPLKTTEKFIEFEGNWTTDSRILVESDDPVPFMLQAMAPEIDVKEMRGSG